MLLFVLASCFDIVPLFFLENEYAEVASNVNLLVSKIANGSLDEATRGSLNLEIATIRRAAIALVTQLSSVVDLPNERRAALSERLQALLDELDRCAAPLTKPPTQVEPVINSGKVGGSSSVSKYTGTIQVCFLMDLTMSMREWLQSLKRFAKKIMQVIGEGYPAARSIEYAFIGYRDFQDDEMFVRSPFSRNIQDLMDVVEPQYATGGGGDDPEDVAGGLKEVCELKWTAQTRVLVHFADAPCHGKVRMG